MKLPLFGASFLPDAAASLRGFPRLIQSAVWTDVSNLDGEDCTSSQHSILLFFGTLDQAKQVQSLLKAYFQNVNVANATLRAVVLETWLLLDYAVRGLVMSGLRLDRIDHDTLDLRYSLLPQSFEGCLRLLRKLVKYNEPLPIEPEKPFQARLRKLTFLKEFDPELPARLASAECAYRKAYQIPEPERVFFKESQYRFVPDGWLEVAKTVDQDWVDRAKKLNAARNLAAHCHDETRISSKLGFEGANALSQGKKSCLDLAGKLLGVSTKTN